jgi:hypothetical protein
VCVTARQTTILLSYKQKKHPKIGCFFAIFQIYSSVTSALLLPQAQVEI